MTELDVIASVEKCINCDCFDCKYRLEGHCHRIPLLKDVLSVIHLLRDENEQLRQAKEKAQQNQTELMARNAQVEYAKYIDKNKGELIHNISKLISVVRGYCRGYSDDDGEDITLHDVVARMNNLLEYIDASEEYVVAIDRDENEPYFVKR